MTKASANRAARNENSVLLARRSLLIACLLALMGSTFTLHHIVFDSGTRSEIILVSSSVLFEVASLLLLLTLQHIRSEIIATFATAYFGVYLCAGCLLSVVQGQQIAHLAVYLVWFFPLLIFNRIVNTQAVAVAFGRTLLAGPPLLLIGLWPRLEMLLGPQQHFYLINFALSFLTVGIVLNLVTRYKDAYVAELASADVLRAEAAITERLAFFDPLTELPNRFFLRNKLSEALERTDARGMGALLLLDLDNFKVLNDTLGHDIGDLLLKEVANRLQSYAVEGCTLVRLGGDEFVLLLEGLDPFGEHANSAVLAICGRIIGEFVAPYRVGEYDCSTSPSIGVAFFSAASDSPDDLLKRADLALYEAKAQGRNCACFFRPEMQTALDARAMLEADLRRALQNGEFHLVYQPQVNQRGAIFGVEALLRWQHPTRGLISPLEFIPIAEESGAILNIGRWVLETSCAQLSAWSAGPYTRDITISVNVSMRQLLDVHFVTTVMTILESTKIDPRRLKLEMTESAVMEMVEESVAKMSELNRLGVSFSLDDFGTGYSSLAHLKRLPLDQIKIDRSFVRDVLTDVTDASIARTIVSLADNLNLSVVAEGVETEGQRDFLVHQGCYAFQGFFFSRPLAADQVEAFAAESVRHFPGPLHHAHPGARRQACDRSNYEPTQLSDGEMMARI